MATADPPAWFGRAITDGIAKLVLLNLDGHPPAEMVELTRDIWVEAIWGARRDWGEDVDASRLEGGFRKLTSTCTKWPAPRALLDAMPARPKPKPVLVEEVDDPAGRAEVRRFLDREFGEAGGPQTPLGRVVRAALERVVDG